MSMFLPRNEKNPLCFKYCSSILPLPPPKMRTAQPTSHQKISWPKRQVPSPLVDPALSKPVMDVHRMPVRAVHGITVSITQGIYYIKMK